jgi:hypothetical protein
MYLGEDHKTKENFCPFCNHQLDGCSQVNGNNFPDPGSYSVCIQCGNVSVFDDDLSLRKPHAEEESEIQKNPNVLEAQRAIFEIHVARELKLKHGFGYGNA